MLRILRRQHEERIGQRMRHAIHGDVIFLHALEQRALRFWRRAIHLIDEDNLRKERPRMKHEPLLLAVENRIADDVRRQHVARELNPPKLQPDRARQRVRKRRLPHARQIFDQQMPAPEQARDRETHGGFLADDDLADLGDERLDAGFHSRETFRAKARVSSGEFFRARLASFANSDERSRRNEFHRRHHSLHFVW